MSDAVARPRQPVDIDEFERRLRGPEPARAMAGDPLAELARLVEGAQESAARPVARQPAPPPVEPQLPPATAFEPVMAAPPAHPNALIEVANPRPDVHVDHSQPHYAPAEDLAPPLAADYRDPPPPEPRRSRSGVYALGGALAVVVLGIGTTFALKSGPGASKDAPLIKAAVGPTKVQPETTPAAAPAQSASVLDKANEKIATSRVVGSVEQPVDSAVTRSVKPPAPAPAPREHANNIFPEPKRVKTVSVRPDGSIIGADMPVSTTPPAPTVPARAAPAPSTPAAAAPTAAKTPAKPPARVAARPADDDDDDVPAPRTATPKTPAKPAAQKPAADAKPTAGGGYAVQLASASSDAEAREKAARLQQQQGRNLDGKRVSVVKGENNGKTVWRVRVVGLSQESATAMCGKVKGGGGDCFVAR